jgi:hypothetical protein
MWSNKIATTKRMSPTSIDWLLPFFINAFERTWLYDNGYYHIFDI